LLVRRLWRCASALLRQTACLFSGATACVVVPAFYDKHPDEGGGQVLAQWIHHNLPYSSLCFFPTYWAVNINWHERPQRRIDSYTEPKGRWVPEAA
jgi:hypothetical protein